MKARLLAIVFLLCFGSLGTSWGGDASIKPAEKIRVLLVHGGHDFETNQFLAVFKEMPGITVQVVQHPQAQDWFRPERAGEYDVLVFYDMFQKISPEAQAGLVQILKSGKGLVALHHSLASFQSWDEYANIIGGRYHLQKWSDAGVEKPASTYQHDVDFKVHVADPQHPILQGIHDFTIRDEAYGGTELKRDAHVLLTTDQPLNSKHVAWTKNYGQSRIVYLQLGHDHQAYENPTYRRLVKQAIRWVARKPAGS